MGTGYFVVHSVPSKHRETLSRIKPAPHTWRTTPSVPFKNTTNYLHVAPSISSPSIRSFFFSSGTLLRPCVHLPYSLQENVYLPTTLTSPQYSFNTSCLEKQPCAAQRIACFMPSHPIQLKMQNISRSTVSLFIKNVLHLHTPAVPRGVPHVKFAKRHRS